MRPVYCLEADPVADRYRHVRVGVGVKHAHRAASDEIPASRRDGGIDRRLAVGNCHCAARYSLSGGRQPGGGNPFVYLTEVGEPGRETNGVDAVFRRAVYGDDIVR